MDGDPVRFSAKSKSKKIVISRHGIDLAGASTDRDWTSCLSLKGGMNARYIPTMIEAGSLIAYLINADDLNIQKPIARLKINPFIKTDDPKKFLLYPDTTVYGNYKNSDFVNFVTDWTLKFNKHINFTEGEYFLDNRCHTDGRSKVNYSENEVDLGIKIKDKTESYRNYKNWLSGTHGTVNLFSGYTIKNLYNNLESEDINPNTVEDYSKFLVDSDLTSLLIQYINKESNEKTESMISDKTKLISALFRGLGKEIEKVGEEKSRVIAYTYNKILPEEFKENLFSMKFPVSSKTYFMNWLRNKFLNYGLIDPKFVKVD
jgi:hypothetical protein